MPSDLSYLHFPSPVSRAKSIKENLRISGTPLYIIVRQVRTPRRPHPFPTFKTLKLALGFSVVKIAIPLNGVGGFKALLPTVQKYTPHPQQTHPRKATGPITVLFAAPTFQPTDVKYMSQGENTALTLT